MKLIFKNEDYKIYECRRDDDGKFAQVIVCDKFGAKLVADLSWLWGELTMVDFYKVECTYTDVKEAKKIVERDLIKVYCNE